MSVLLAAPVVHYTLHVVVPHPRTDVAPLVHCVEQWDSAPARRAYSVVVFVVLFCVPLTTTAALYGRIYDRPQRWTWVSFSQPDPTHLMLDPTQPMGWVNLSHVHL